MDLHLKLAEVITKLLDNTFSIGKFRFGLDPLLGLIPGIGDAISLVFSFYLVWIGIVMKIPNDAVHKMIRNILADFLIGLVPILGDATDFVFKANSRNLAILKQHTQSRVIEGEIL